MSCVFCCVCDVCLVGLARCRKERQYRCLFFPKTSKFFNAESDSAPCFCSHSLLSPSSTRKSVLLRAFSSYVQVQVIIGIRNHRKESKTQGCDFYGISFIVTVYRKA